MTMFATRKRVVIIVHVNLDTNLDQTKLHVKVGFVS